MNSGASGISLSGAGDVFKVSICQLGNMPACHHPAILDSQLANFPICQHANMPTFRLVGFLAYMGRQQKGERGRDRWAEVGYKEPPLGGV